MNTHGINIASNTRWLARQPAAGTGTGSRAGIGCVHWTGRAGPDRALRNENGGSLYVLKTGEQVRFDDSFKVLTIRSKC